MRLAASLKSPASLAFLFWGGVLALVWLQITYLSYSGYWLVDEEMAIHSLGHGAYTDSWLFAGQGHPDSYYQYLHPGLPLQFLCWLAYRLTATHLLATPYEVFAEHLLNPEPFHAATQWLGLALSLFGLYLVWRRSRVLGAATTFLALALPFTNWGNWTVSFWRLDSDTFSLPLAGLLAYSLESSLTQDRRSGWVALGAVLAAAYLTKLNHISWIIGAGAAWMVWLAVNNPGLRALGRSFAYLLAGFAGVMLLGAVFMGRDQMLRMFAFQWKVAVRGGRYGEGPEGLPGLQSLGSNIPTDPACIIALFFVLLIVSVILRKRKMTEWNRAWLPSGVFFVVSLSVGLLLMLKQSRPHYFVPAASLLPFAALWLAEAWNRRAPACLVFLAVPALLLAVSAWRFAAARTDIAQQRQADVGAFLALPLDKGEVRLWTFKVTSAEYLRRLTVQFSGQRQLATVVDAIQPQDMEFNVWRNMVRVNGQWRSIADLPWRYAAFERRYYPSAKDLPQPFQDPTFKVVEKSYLIEVVRSK